MSYPGFVMRIRHFLGHERQLAQCYFEKWKNKKAVYLIMMPEHGNLGDHAIAYAASLILEQLKIPFIPVSTEKLKDWQHKNMLHVMNGRTILINGGGNLGTIWFSLEKVIRDVIRSNPESKIMILPNTMYYHEGEKGEKELAASERIYNAHKQLTVFAREKETFRLATEHYKNVKLVPDLALYLNYSEESFPRSGCLLCLRTDKEKTRTQSEDDEIMRQISSLFKDKISFRDMNVGYSILSVNRAKEIKKQCDLFKHAQVVITDRLHGMIFCAITGTPCVVIDSRSPKVKGCYEWIRDLPYIRFCDDVSQLSDIIRSLPKESLQYDNSFLGPYFDELKKDICSAAGK